MYVKKAIVVSKYSNNAEALKSLLNKEGFGDVLVLEDSTVAKEMVVSDEYDLIVINVPLEKETGLELATFCGENTTSSIMVIVQENKSVEVARMMTSKGIMVISKPINKHLFHHYLMFSECFKKRMHRVVKENTRLKSQVETMKLVNRAKILLMQNLRMTESQAHHYLEKQAMDLRKSKYDIALRILNTYEN